VKAERAYELAFGAAPIVLIVACWHIVTAAGMAPAALLPSPLQVLSRLAEQLHNPHFLQHVATTLFRLFAGFSIAVVVGISLGIAAASQRSFEALLRPLVRVLAPVPKIALYPALVLLLGFEHASKVALVAADATFPILLATYQGAAAVERKLIWSALAAGASGPRVLLNVVLPAALPVVLTGCRIGLIISCIVVFLAEMLTSTDGLGHLLIYASRTFQTVDMFVPLITISLLGLLLNAAFNALTAWLLTGFPDEA
jgi:NitT/TauT family transport system permease protein